MCVLRTTNPMKVRRTRTGGPTFTAASVFRRSADGADLATRLTEYAVLVTHPAVPEIAADYWLHSEPFYRAVQAELTTLGQVEPGVADALDGLALRPGDVHAEETLRTRLAGLLADRPGLAGAAAHAVARADDNVYIGYLRGSRYRPDAPPVTADDLRERGRRLALGERAGGPSPRRPAPTGPAAVHVVIPLMDRGGTGRVRNALACLLALRDQSLPAARYRVTLAEFDTHPRWRHAVEPLVDHYLHVRADGEFNKSWTLNVGVRHAPVDAPVVCLLDADILADRDFLARNLARFDDPAHGAHLPHTEMLSLDPAASDALIARRCTGRSAPLSMARGLLLRDVPGGCLWLRRSVFDRIGGLDERYLGWGGEDEDMLVRTALAGATTQYDDVMLHLSHERPPMRRPDGQPFNAHLTVGSWTGDAGYGALSGPAVPVGRLP
jgi:hypothetical protein